MSHGGADNATDEDGFGAAERVFLFLFLLLLLLLAAGGSAAAASWLVGQKRRQMYYTTRGELGSARRERSRRFRSLLPLSLLPCLGVLLGREGMLMLDGGMVMGCGTFVEGLHVALEDTSFGERRIELVWGGMGLGS